MYVLGIVTVPKSEISGIRMVCTIHSSAPDYKGFRFPSEMISHAGSSHHQWEEALFMASR